MPSTKTLDEVADAIVRMPLDERPTESALGLFEASGYMDHRGEISVEDLYVRLVRNPDLVDAWQGWVDDNRGYPAWYFATIETDRYEVGFVPFRGPVSDRQVFDDRARACAVYLRSEMELFAESVEIWRRPWRVIRELIRWFWEEFRDSRDRARRRR